MKYRFGTRRRGAQVSGSGPKRTQQPTISRYTPELSGKLCCVHLGHFLIIQQLDYYLQNHYTGFREVGNGPKWTQQLPNPSLIYPPGLGCCCVHLGPLEPELQNYLCVLFNGPLFPFSPDLPIMDACLLWLLSFRIFSQLQLITSVTSLQTSFPQSVAHIRDFNFRSNELFL